MVVFQGGKPDKKAYRRFKIKSVDGQNDYASMQEMIFRRIERGIKEQNEGKDPKKSSFLPFPDVFCIDGGKTHVDAVRSILQMYPDVHIEVCGMVKDDHRYALGYHQTLRKKGMLESRLEEIPGIGKKRRELLMRHYGSLNNLKKTTLDELKTLPGMSDKTAQAVFDYFNDDEHKTKSEEKRENK